MRSLNKKQKSLLRAWFFLNKSKVENGVAFFNVDKCSEFSFELWEELERINDFETLSQEVNNFIQELGMEGVD